MNISPKTQSNELLDEYPFLEHFFSSYGPSSSALRSKTARKALGTESTLRRLAAVGGVDLDSFMTDIAKEVRGATGQPMHITGFGRSHFKESAARMRALEDSFVALKEGKDIELAKQRIIDVAEDVEPHEIAAVEHTLAYKGIPFEELQRLCDTHVGSVCQLLERHASIEVLPGHPINTYLTENEKIESLANLVSRLGIDLQESNDSSDIDPCLVEIKKALEGLKGVETHYVRKENHLFPPFERHGLTGPPHVTWEIHDEIRMGLRNVNRAVDKKDLSFLQKNVPDLRNAIVDMVEKENRIVFPLALNTLTSSEWARIKHSDDKLGYDFVTPGTEWSPASSPSVIPPRSSSFPSLAGKDEALQLDVGSLNIEQLNLIFGHLPLDISYVDEFDEVKFYNSSENRIFPRGEQAIGRKVQYCHPVGSLHLVNRILSEFRQGAKNTAEFWFEMKGKFIHSRYIAIRDKEGSYRGCLEVAQDVTDIRKLEGTKRLLDWKDV